MLILLLFWTIVVSDSYEILNLDTLSDREYKVRHPLYFLELFTETIFFIDSIFKGVVFSNTSQ